MSRYAVGQYVMLNLFIAVMLEYYQREQDATEQYLKPEDYKSFEAVWTEMVRLKRTKYIEGIVCVRARGRAPNIV